MCINTYMIHTAVYTLWLYEAVTFIQVSMVKPEVIMAMEKFVYSGYVWVIAIVVGSGQGQTVSYTPSVSLYCAYSRAWFVGDVTTRKKRRDLLHSIHCTVVYFVLWICAETEDGFSVVETCCRCLVAEKVVFRLDLHLFVCLTGTWQNMSRLLFLMWITGRLLFVF